MQKIVFLDRQSLRAELRTPSFAHEWTEHVQTRPDQVVERLQHATVAISNKVPIRRDTLAQLPHLKMIAMAVGYGSEAALSRAFKAQCGLSPREWRQLREQDTPD